jgi:hypothetical protein
MEMQNMEIPSDQSEEDLKDICEEAPKATAEDEAEDNEDDDDKIILNVGGVRHETLISTLTNKAGTRLASLALRHRKFYPGITKEYFFDRHPGVFSTVIDFYRNGKVMFITLFIV